MVAVEPRKRKFHEVSFLYFLCFSWVCISWPNIFRGNISFSVQMSHAEILHAVLCLDPTAVIIYYECTVPWLINLTRHISSTSEPRLNYTNLNISHDTFVIFQLKDLPANICLIYILVKEFDVQTLSANRLNPTISMIYYDISPCSTLVKISNADTLLADLRLNPTTLKYMILYIKCILYIKYSSSRSLSPSHHLENIWYCISNAYYA